MGQSLRVLPGFAEDSSPFDSMAEDPSVFWKEVAADLRQERVWSEIDPDVINAVLTGLAMDLREWLFDDVDMVVAHDLLDALLSSFEDMVRTGTTERAAGGLAIWWGWMLPTRPDATPSEVVEWYRRLLHWQLDSGDPHMRESAQDALDLWPPNWPQ